MIIRRPGLLPSATLALATGLVSARAAAQDLPLKRPAVTAIATACPVRPAAAEATVATQHDEANRLASLGEAAELEGNHSAARDFYAQATQLDPNEPNIAYRLAREDEEIPDTAGAIREYCRYLRLAQGSTDTAQTTARIRALVPRSTLDRGENAARAFARGISRYGVQDWDGAATAFSSAITGDTALADAFYDRALARQHQGRVIDAIHDFEHYLALDPAADDATIVSARVAELRGSFPSTGTAIARGVLPGGGQFYTHQPILGAVLLAAAGGGIFLAIQSKTVTVLVDSTFTGPFGTTYTQQVPVQEKQHPNTAAGLGIAGAAMAIGMVEAAIVAHGRSSGLNDSATGSETHVTWAPLVAPLPGGRMALGLSLTP
jgi:tetratricopeptide (TPR) repeat protein